MKARVFSKIERCRAMASNFSRASSAPTKRRSVRSCRFRMTFRSVRSNQCSIRFKSLNRMLHWFERTDLNVILNLQDLTERRLVGALEALEKFDAMALQRSIFENTRAFMGLKTRGVVYDVTNTYF